MGGPFRLVHVTALNKRRVRGFFSPRARGVGFPLTRGAHPVCFFSHAPERVAATVLSVLLSLLLLLACVLVLFPVGWLCAVSGCHPVFFDSLCARYVQRRILCARLGEWVCASLVAGRGYCLACGCVVDGVLRLLRARPGSSLGVIG